MDKERRATRPGINTKCDAKTWNKDELNTIPGRRDGNVIGNRDPQRHVTETRTVGWKPGCKCLSDDIVSPLCEPDNGVPIPFDPVPCKVLNLFMGSGTVGVVCKQLGRAFIGIDASAKYVEMARRRIANPEPLPKIPDAEGQAVMEFDTL